MAVSGIKTFGPLLDAFKVVPMVTRPLDFQQEVEEYQETAPTKHISNSALLGKFYWPEL